MAKRPDVREYWCVGVGRERRCCRIGRRKERVLPGPVWERRKVSWVVVRRCGIARDWMRVGWIMERNFDKWWQMAGEMPRAENSFSGVIGQVVVVEGCASSDCSGVDCFGGTGVVSF